MAKKKNKNKSEEELNTDKVVVDKAEEHISKDELEPVVEKTLQEKYEELNGKYLLLYSDFDNFRRRSIREKADIISSASGAVINDLLSVLDDFERAIANNDKVKDEEALREGFRLIYHKFLNTLTAKGLESMDAKGDVFDADRHEAVTQIPVEEVDQKGKVVDVVERGYNLKGTVLRYAKVVVGK